MAQRAMQTGRHVHQALSRARWSILQTGLITSSLTLFGIYVLASRVSDQEFLPMDWYFRHWIPVGPLLVGAAAASGYLIGAHWTGLRIRGWLYICVLLLQIVAYLTAHYAQFVTRHIVYRSTDLPVSFYTFFTYATLDMGANFQNAMMRQPWFCLLLRLFEMFAFMLTAILTPAILRRQPYCASCGGVTRDRPAGSVSSLDDLPHLAQLATLGPPTDARQLQLFLGAEQFSDPARLAIRLTRCVVCGTGTLHADGNPPEKPITLYPQLAEKLWSRPTTTPTHTGASHFSR